MPETPSIDQRAESLVEEFELFDDWISRYEYLIEMGKSLEPLDEHYRTDTYRIRGCQSQVWLYAEPRDCHIHLKADSDALITKGLVAVLLRVLNDQCSAEVAKADLSFLDRIGMTEHLSPTRKNGLDAMIRQIRNYAFTFSQAYT